MNGKKASTSLPNGSKVKMESKDRSRKLYALTHILVCVIFMTSGSKAKYMAQNCGKETKWLPVIFEKKGPFLNLQGLRSLGALFLCR